MDFFLTEIENLRDLFYIFDADRAGLLSRGQFAELIKELRNGVALKANQLDEIFRQYTHDWREGTMSMSEFVTYVSQHRDGHMSRHSFQQSAVFDYDPEKVRKIKYQFCICVNLNL